MMLWSYNLHLTQKGLQILSKQCNNVPCYSLHPKIWTHENNIHTCPFCLKIFQTLMRWWVRIKSVCGFSAHLRCASRWAGIQKRLQHASTSEECCCPWCSQPRSRSLLEHPLKQQTPIKKMIARGMKNCLTLAKYAAQVYATMAVLEGALCLKMKLNILFLVWY